jgi:small subunit ribosomal protein S16
MLIIRLQRVGRTNDPSFRVVLTDTRRAPRSGGFLEIVGSYNARQGKPELKEDRIKYWMSQGAKVSDTVHNLLVVQKIIPGPKRGASPVTKPKAIVAEEPTTAPTETPAAEPAPAV